MSDCSPDYKGIVICTKEDISYFIQLVLAVRMKSYIKSFFFLFGKLSMLVIMSLMVVLDVTFSC